MYTLRTINKETNVENNHSLGSRYTVYHRDKSPKAFQEIVNRYDIPDVTPPTAFIESELGQLSHVYDSQYAYIMTESGKTFERI